MTEIFILCWTNDQNVSAKNTGCYMHEALANCFSP